MSDYEYYTMLYNQWKTWKDLEQKTSSQRAKIEKELFEKCDISTLVKITKEVEGGQKRL